MANVRRRVGFVQASILVALVGAFWGAAAGAQSPAPPKVNVPVVDHPDLGRLHWQLACQASTFRQMTCFDMLDYLHARVIHHVELTTGQALAADMPGARVGPDMTDDQGNALLAKLKAVKMDVVSYDAGVLGPDAASAARVFALGKALGVKNIVADKVTIPMPVADKMATDAGLSLAIVNGEDEIKGRSAHVGVCADFAAWQRAGLDPMKQLEKLGGHVIEIRLDDTDSSGKDVPVGKGVVPVPAILRFLQNQAFIGVFALGAYSGTPDEQAARWSASVTAFSADLAALPKVRGLSMAEIAQIKLDTKKHIGDQPDKAPPPAHLSPDLSPGSILAATRKVAGWQMARARKTFNRQWTYGALYAGCMALADATGSDEYRNEMLAMAKRQKWMIKVKRYASADDQCIGQTYLDLYFQNHDPAMLASTQYALDRVLTMPPRPANGPPPAAKPAKPAPAAAKKAAKTTAAAQKPGKPALARSSTARTRTARTAGRRPRGPRHKNPWWWCDALYMAPPVWSRMYRATGDPKYLDYMNRQWWATSAELYDPRDHLFHRDASFIKLTEPNGKPVYWARGNGWVLAGLARTIPLLPADFPDRPKYIALFRELAAAIVPLQGKDGLWRAGLLDPDDYDLPETSGSGFITYALAWGINQGLLDRATYLPVVAAAWKGLLTHVYADGRLGCVQQTGAAPAHFKPTATAVYGVGAFLLAGSEIYRLAESPDIQIPASAGGQQ